MNRPTSTVLPDWIFLDFPKIASALLTNEVWIYKNVDNTTLVYPEELPVVTELELWVATFAVFAQKLEVWKSINRKSYCQDFLLTTAGYANFTKYQSIDDSLLEQARFENIMDIAGIGEIVLGWGASNSLYGAGLGQLETFNAMLEPTAAEAYERSKLQTIQSEMTTQIMDVSVKNIITQNKTLFDELGLTNLLNI